MLLPRLTSPTTRLLIKGLGRRFFHSTFPRNKHPTYHGNIFPPVDCWLGSDRSQYIEPACKVAIVIEGGSQIGYTVANGLLAQYVQTVVISSADCESGQKATRRLNADHGLDKAVFIQTDPSCTSDLEGLFKETYSSYGRADIVVNNPKQVAATDSWEFDLNMNLINIFRSTVVALQFMGQGGKPTKDSSRIIINNATTAGIQPVVSMPAHTAAQCGVIGATRSFGDPSTFTKTGVRVVGLLSDIVSLQEDSKGQPVNPEAKSIGMASVHLVKRGPSGTIWMVRGGRLELVEFPPTASYAKVVQKYV